MEKLNLEKIIEKEARELQNDLERVYGDEYSEGNLDILETIKEVEPDATNEEKLKTLKYIRSMSGLLDLKEQKGIKNKKTDKKKRKDKAKMRKKSKQKNRKK